jgi:hypothetical protein
MIEFLIAFAWYSALFAGGSIIFSAGFVLLCWIGRKVIPSRWL